MRRLLGACALLLMVGAASAGEIRIAWYGQSMFLIVTPKGTRIVLDPHNIDGYQVKPLKADLVLMSHLHSDHTRMEVIENAKDVQQFNALNNVNIFNVTNPALGAVNNFQTFGTTGLTGCVSLR